MEVLMLRLDVYDRTHREIFIYWRNIIQSFEKTPISVKKFVYNTIAEEEIAKNVTSPYLFDLCNSYTHRDIEIDETNKALTDILQDLGIYAKYPLSRDSEEKEKENAYLLLRSMNSTNQLEKKKDFYELEDTKRLTIRDRNNIYVMIEKEMKKFWNHIDTLILDSYKQLLIDITGSDKFADAFMKELLRYGVMKDLVEAKRNYDYEKIIDITGMIDECIGDWVVDVEQLVGAE